MTGFSKLNKEVLRLAVPSILANITIPFVGIVDTAIAGHISDASAIGGIAIGTMLFDLLYWNFGFLRAGTAGMTAQMWGQEKETIHAPETGHTVETEYTVETVHIVETEYIQSLQRQTKRQKQLSSTGDILAQSLGVALAGAALILLLQWVFLTVALSLIPCSDEVAGFARRYFYIRIWAAPATLSLMAIKGWFIGMQNTVAAMTTDLVVNITNMLASWLLAVCTPLGAMGVAWGTLIAQYAGLLSAVILIIRVARKDKTVFGGTSLSNALHREKIRRLVVLNGNLFVRSLCMMVVYVGFTSLASKYGDTELAVSSIMMKLFLLFSYFIDGFAYAGEALTGRFFGEKNTEGVRQSVKILFVWTICLGALCTLTYGLAGTGMTSLMTNKQEIIDASRPYLIWLILMPLISCLAFMWDGIFIGATAGKELRNCMVWSAVGFVAAYLILYKHIGIQALYAAYFVHLAVRTIYLTLKWKKTERTIANVQ